MFEKLAEKLAVAYPVRILGILGILGILAGILAMLAGILAGILAGCWGYWHGYWQGYWGYWQGYWGYWGYCCSCISGILAGILGLANPPLRAELER